MILKNQISRSSLNISLLLFLFASLFIHPIPALAWEVQDHALPNFEEFSNSVQNGEANLLRGVYVSNILALPVIQQPSGRAVYVSNNDGEVTQFGMASRYGNVGLLAHNHLAGRSFSRLAPGQEVRLVYGDGKVEYFIVTQVLRYQALEPNSPWSSFRDLNDKDETLSVEQVFKRVYFGDRHVTFQTCIEANGIMSWGRLFVLAIPKSEYTRLTHKALAAQ